MISEGKADRREVLLAGAAALGLGAVLGAAGEAEANQPNMEAALNSLYSAQNSLQHAEHNKGGHRVNALNLVSQAIEEVKLGIAAG